MMTVEEVRAEFEENSDPVKIKRIRSEIRNKYERYSPPAIGLGTGMMAHKLLELGVSESRIPQIILAADVLWQALCQLDSGNCVRVKEIGGVEGMLKLYLECDPSMNPLEEVLGKEE